MTIQQLKEEARKEVDDYYTINPKYRTKDNLKDFIDSFIDKAYEEGKRENKERIKELEEIEFRYNNL